jgi:hypothetical protein
MIYDAIDFTRTNFAALLVIFAMICALCLTAVTMLRDYLDATRYRVRARRMRRYRY